MLPSIPSHKTIITLHSHASMALAHAIVLLLTSLSLLDPQAYRNISGVNITNNINTNSSFLRSGSTTLIYSLDGVMGESENNVVGVLKFEASSILSLRGSSRASLPGVKPAGWVLTLMGDGCRALMIINADCRWPNRSYSSLSEDCSGCWALHHNVAPEPRTCSNLCVF
jgi:hypothetical protein